MSEPEEKKKQESLFRLAPTRYATAFVIDNFYADPDAVRRTALATAKQADLRFWKGKRSQPLPNLDHLRLYFEDLIGESLKLRSHFHVCTSADPLVYHCDTQEWAAVVFLTPDAPPECGTTLWRSKRTGLRRWPLESDTVGTGKTIQQLGDETVNGDSLLDETKWKRVDQIGNVYNRLVVWRGKMFHSASKYFGSDESNGRLFQLFFFD